MTHFRYITLAQIGFLLTVCTLIAVVGCDGVINGQRYDVCGICGGDNSTCRLISGLYTKPHLVAGYNYITEIPQQACNLSIAEMKKTNNLLALRYKNGSYILNGDWAPDKAGKIEAAGTTFTFVKGDEKSGDVISASGPLLQPLDLLLLYRQINLGIKYEYRLPATFAESAVKELELSPPVQAVSDSSSANSFQYSGQMTEIKRYGNESERHRRLLKPGNSNSGVNYSIELQGLVRDEESKPRNRSRKKKFIWKVTGYNPCSKTCGSGGIQTPLISCVKENNQMQIVSDKRCSNVDKPTLQPIHCTLPSCSAEWVLSDWSECSTSCGEGVETRDLSCKQEISPNIAATVPDGTCLTSPALNILRTRPCFKQSCNITIHVNSSGSGDPNSKPYWYIGPWSACSVKCGTGVRTRKVLCISKSNEGCAMIERPAEQITCDMGPCVPSPPSHSWFMTAWTEQCSESCGTGIQTRKLYCSAGPDSESSCDANSKPETVRACSSDKKCGGQWFSGPWTQCSEGCGWGKQGRIVICIASDKQQNIHRVVNNSSCTDKDRPSMEQACFEKPCSASWYAASWSQCSRKCDSGVQRREVRCLNSELQTSTECVEEDKPATRRSCNTHKCSQYNNAGVSATNTEDTTSEEMNTNLPEIHPTVDSKNDNSDETDDCKDKYPKCNLVVQARLCNSQYYQSSCCYSCRKVLTMNQSSATPTSSL